MEDPNLASFGTFALLDFIFFFQSWMARGNLIFYIPILLLHNQSHVTTHTLFSTALWLMSRHLNAATWFQKPWSIGAASIGKIEIVKFLCFLFGNVLMKWPKIWSNVNMTQIKFVSKNWLHNTANSCQQLNFDSSWPD